MNAPTAPEGFYIASNGQVVPDGFWLNAQGGMDPVANIKPQDQLEDELVRKLVGKAIDFRGALAKFKHDALADTAAFRAEVAAEYGANKGGAKGNMTLRTYDGSMSVKVAVAETISFGAELTAAKELIDDCIVEWSEGANGNLRVIIDDAFQVNKEGKIDTGRVLGLRRHSIEDPAWNRAMDAIADAVRITGTRTYVRFYTTDANGGDVAVSLDLAAL